jgi:hypothetical protein
MIGLTKSGEITRYKLVHPELNRRFAFPKFLASHCTIVADSGHSPTVRSFCVSALAEGSWE